MKEIQIRIIELESELRDLIKTPKRFQAFKHGERIAVLEGEIKGLKWAFNFAFSVPDPNIIEQ